MAVVGVAGGELAHSAPRGGGLAQARKVSIETIAEKLVTRMRRRYNRSMAEREAVPPAGHSGLSTFLMTLRVRLLALVLLSAGTLLARAFHASPVVGAALPVWAVLGAGISIASCWGLWRHLTSVRDGRVTGWLSWALFVVSTILDLYALVSVLGIVAPQLMFGVSLDAGRAIALAELGAFVALAPVAASHAQVAAGVGGRDIQQRAWRAVRYVVLVFLIVLGAGYAIVTQRALPEAIALAAVGLSVVLVILALAKVLGVTRFLLAYLRTMALAESSTSIELRAWRGA